MNRTYLLTLGLILSCSGAGVAQPRQLTLHDAIQAALENNATVQIAVEQEIQAAARSEEQRAALLPNIGGNGSYINQSVNLGARGIRFPGIPTRVGPFDVYDARLQYSEPILDVSLIRRYQATRRSREASEFDTEAARNRVAAMVARLYFNVQRARAMTDTVRAQLELDNSLLQLARDRQEFGVGTGLDVTRSQSRLAADQHRLLQTENEARTAELQLLRAMGERPGFALNLTDALASAAIPVEAADEAVNVALRNRPELKAEQQRIEAARLGVRGAASERLPAVQAFADYGDNGASSAFVPTRSIGVQVQLPLFDGGRRGAHRTLSESQLRQAEIRAKDLRDDIEFDVRVAVDNMASAQAQLRAAEESLNLSQQELSLARLRFEAQVTTQLDVVNAQALLAEARSRQVNAVFALRAAEVEYRRATGVEIR
jgi:outer membrane protein TolC